MELDSELDRLRKYSSIDSELNKAEKKHPVWPGNMFEQSAILVEEVGEVVKAVLHYHHEGGSLDDVKKELEQTGAMCIRMLKNLPDTNEQSKS